MGQKRLVMMKSIFRLNEMPAVPREQQCSNRRAVAYMSSLGTIFTVWHCKKYTNVLTNTKDVVSRNSEFRNKTVELQVIKSKLRIINSELRVVKSEFRVVESDFRVVKSDFRVVKSDLPVTV